MKDTKYFESIGRRKTSIARVRLFPESKMSFVINDKTLAECFPTKELESVVKAPFTKVAPDLKFKVSAIVSGGGISSQAESIRLGISRALIVMDHALRGALKKEGFLKRDPRAKERRKFGLKKARKSPQWSKR